MQNLHPLDPAYGHSVGGKDSYADPEECSEDSDSDEDYGSIQRPAFLVEGEPDFDSGPPEDGLEYLRRVRWEAAQIPEVTVAKLDMNKLNKEQTLYMPKIPDIAKCPEHLAPLKKWEDAFLADFAELRAALSHLEDSRVENSDRQHPVFSFHEDYSCQVLESTLPENFDNLTIDSQPLDCSNPKNSDKRLPLSIINEDDTSLSPENSSPRTESSGNYPLLSVILGMDSVARVSMLRKCINSLETKSTLSRSDCMWLFALCAAIDTPLHADTCAALRSLLRKCASLRAEKSELDDEVVMLNILVTIAGRYFKQSEN
ncbi:hypothetical protein VitviT2T_007340 [Vitis vinifera]|uniref:Gem-associated protein 2 n=2 Tax=Vitis vinifera TaxID=29760 RepID=A0ABY9BZT6_VITVI|nr:hypothetical protein VitviT2T_007340 [Vitis vinifera]